MGASFLNFSPFTALGVGTGGGSSIPLSTVTTKGDLIAATGNAAVARLGVGADGQVLTADAAQATGVKWAATGAVLSSSFTSKGDLLAGTGASTATRLGVGADGQVLTADSTQATGLRWGAAAGGGIPLSTVTTKGDLIAGTAASAVARVGVGADGQVLTADSTQAAGVKWAAAAGGTGNGVPIPDRQWGIFWGTEASPFWATSGLNRILTTVTGGAGGVVNGGSAGIVGFQSSAALGNSAGVQGPFDMFLVGMTGLNRGPKLAAKILMAEAASNTTRWWVGYADSQLSTVVPTIAAAASAVRYVAWAADTAVSANWILMSGDGANHSGIDSGIPIDMVGTTGRSYTMTLDWTLNGSLVGTIKRSDGTGVTATITKTTNLSPIATNKVGPWLGGVNKNAAAHNYWLARATFEGEVDAR